MDKDGISIESVKDFKIKASGDIKAEGVNAQIKASAELKLKGDSSAEYASGGTTNVKGSMVNIN